MKILYISVEPIYPADTGSRIRDYQLITALSVRHEVEVAYLATESMAEESDAPYRRAWQIPLDKPLATLTAKDRVWLLLKAIVSGSFPMTCFFLGRTQRAALLRVVAECRPAVVILQSSYLLPLGAEIKRHSEASVVLDAHNIEWQLQRRMADTASSSVVMKWVKRWLANNLRIMEEQADRNVSAIAAVSEVEAAWWREKCPASMVSVIANGVDVDFFKTRKPLPKEPVIAFCGSMSYLPNDEGVLWFARNVWPLVSQALPETKWLIIGKDPSDAVKALAGERIIVTGRVEEVRSYIEQSRLSVVPLLAGGGTRLKILEAMSMKRVIVSTSLGAEGIAASDGLILADTPQMMAAVILKMLASDRLELLGQQNRQRVMDEYGWSAIGVTLADLVEKVGKSHAS